MESPAGSAALSTAANGGGDGGACGGEVVKDEAGFSQVDPFLVEALQNPRHRLTILRMEIDVQRFLQNSDQLQLEFQHFPTSYLRCAMHRVAQHYGLQTTVSDNGLDGAGKIIVRKTAECCFPAIRLSDIPAKQPENDISGQPKFVICTRPNKEMQNGSGESMMKRGTVKTVEERKEEYDKARARIFSSCGDSDFTSESSPVASNASRFYSTIDETERHKTITSESERNSPEPERNITTGGTSTVAIFKDREKDRSDPDYDRSYDRYAKSSKQNFSVGPYNVLQPPFLPYSTGFPQMGHLQSSAQTPGVFLTSNHIMNPYYSIGCNQNTKDSGCINPATFYAHSYRQFKQNLFQVPLYPQSLKYGNSHAL